MLKNVSLCLLPLHPITAIILVHTELHFTGYSTARKFSAKVIKIRAAPSLIKAAVISKGIWSKWEMTQKRDFTFKVEDKAPQMTQAVALSFLRLQPQYTNQYWGPASGFRQALIS